MGNALVLYKLPNPVTVTPLWLLRIPMVMIPLLPGRTGLPLIGLTISVP